MNPTRHYTREEIQSLGNDSLLAIAKQSGFDWIIKELIWRNLKSRGMYEGTPNPAVPAQSRYKYSEIMAMQRDTPLFLNALGLWPQVRETVITNFEAQMLPSAFAQGHPVMATGIPLSTSPRLISAGESPQLFEAARIGDLSIIQRLLASGVNVNSRDSTGRTALGYAAINNNIGIVEFLLNNGADVNLGDNKQRTPLMFASIKGNDEIVSILISHGARINAADYNSQTPLMFAAGNNKYHTVLKLLKAGADKDMRDNKGNYPINLARHDDVMDLLASYHADIAYRTYL